MNATGSLVSDHHLYSWVMFETSSVRFFINALAFYEEMLKKEQAEIDADPVLGAFVTEETRRETRFDLPTRKARYIREWLEEAMANAKDDWDITLSIRHGDVRYLKSVSHLYLGMVKERRNRLSTKPNVGANALEALDRQISKYEELIEMSGIFKGAEPVALIAAQGPCVPLRTGEMADEDVPLTKVRRPRPVVVSSIEILDPELRRRCLDLLQGFCGEEQRDRYDTVIAEAARVLEHRLRAFARIEDGSTAIDVVNQIFSKESPLLVLSSVANEQQAAQLLFRGFFGYVRNPVQHRLIGELPLERVVQILGMVDYLLHLLRSAPADDPVPRE